MARRKVALVFDVNETLLDLRGLDRPFEQVFGDAEVRGEWFQQLLQSALVSTVTDAYADFGTIGRAALAMVGRRRGRQLADAHRRSCCRRVLRICLNASTAGTTSDTRLSPGAGIRPPSRGQ